jgi:hypothetical protein
MADGLWPTNCLIKIDVKRWLKIILLLGMVTAFLTPYDADSEEIPALTEATVFEEAIAELPVSNVQNVQAKSSTTKCSVDAPAATHAHSGRNLLIIDITCARLC